MNSTKPESNFRLGQNYDSDYLCGNRLKKLKSIKDRNQKYYKNKLISNKKSKNDDKVKEKKVKKLDPIEKSKKNLPKMTTKRLTLGPKTSNINNNGIFANGKTSNIITNDFLPQNSRQLKARINEDLLWILSKRNQSPKCLQNVSKLKSKLKPIVEKQNKNLIESCDELNVQNECQIYRSRDKPKVSSHQINGSSIRKEISVKNSGKKFTDIKVRKDLSLKTNISKRKVESVGHKPMPSVPSSLTVVQNLMKRYSDERKELAKRMEEFNCDLVSNTCEQLRALAVPLNSRLNKNWIENQIQLRCRSNQIDSNKKSIANQSTDCKPIESTPVFLPLRNQTSIASNNNLTAPKPKKSHPKVEYMMSRILRNVSEGNYDS